MEFKKIIIVGLLISYFSSSIFSKNNDEVLNLRFDIFQEVNFSSEFDAASYLNNQFLLAYYGGGFIDDQLKANNLKRINANNNPIGSSLITKFDYRQLPETLFSKHNIGYSIAVQQNYYQESRFTNNAFQLAFYGNKMFAGTKADLSKMQLNRLSYYQIKTGLFWQNRDKFMEYGFQIAFNIGSLYQNFESNNAYLYTDSLGKEISLIGEFSNYQTSQLNSNANIQGIGGGLDLYFQKYKKQSYIFRIDIQNIGFIRWNSKSMAYHNSETMNFSGIEIDNVFDIDNKLLPTTVSDTLNDFLLSNSDIGSFTSYTPADLKVYGEYYINENISTTALFNYRFNSVYKPLFQLGLQYHFANKVQLGTNLNYGGYTKINLGIDFQMKINHNFVFKLQTRYLSGFLANKFSGIGAFLGINYKIK